MISVVLRIVLSVAISWIYSLFIPPPEGPKAGRLEDFQINVAEYGSRPPKIFGTPMVKGTNLVAYGDYKQTAIKDDSGKK